MAEWHLAHLSEAELRAIRRLEEETGLTLVAWDRGTRRHPAAREEAAEEVSPDQSGLAGLRDAYRAGTAPAP